jgi:predicted DNA-binding protein (MmcQ/YjbR family)
MKTFAVSANAAALRGLLDARPGAVASPTAGVTLYKVMGKMFAILSLREDAFVILKSDPHLAEILREQYAGVGHRSHLDRRFWIAVQTDADVPLDEIERLLDQSYALIVSGLTKKQKADLAAMT